MESRTFFKKTMSVSLISLLLLACKEERRVGDYLQVTDISEPISKQIVIPGSNGTGTALLGAMFFGTAGAIVGSTMKSDDRIVAVQECVIQGTSIGKTFKAIARNEECKKIKKGSNIRCLSELNGNYLGCIGIHNLMEIKEPQ